jgi:putative transcriptional regulator
VWRRVLLSGAITAALVAFLPNPRKAAQSNVRPVQYTGGQDAGLGKILIAKAGLPDPNFADTVVLIVQYDEDKGAVGLILNRRTDVPLSKVFPDVKGAKDDPVFEGGPVETETGQALLRSRVKVEGATHILGDVYASGSKDLIEKSVAAGTTASAFRLYIGYGGWGPGQLEREIAAGGWTVLRGTAAIVFDDEPGSLWQRLQHDSETRIAAELGPRPPQFDAAGAVLP